MAYQTHELKIQGMTCNGCKTILSDFIQSLQGIADFSVDLEKGTAVIKTDVYKNTKQDLINAINTNTPYTAS
jgi:copper chaperone CopZ